MPAPYAFIKVTLLVALLSTLLVQLVLTSPTKSSSSSSSSSDKSHTDKIEKGLPVLKDSTEASLIDKEGLSEKGTLLLDKASILSSLDRSAGRIHKINRVIGSSNMDSKDKEVASDSSSDNAESSSTSATSATTATAAAAVSPPRKAGKAGTFDHLVGANAEEAVKAIKGIHPDFKVMVVPHGSMTTQDFRTDRIRVFSDAAGKVTRAPKIG